MGDIVSISEYKKRKIKSSKLNQEDMANQILESFNYNNITTAIPIVKIAKSYGLRVYWEKFYKNGETNVAGKLLIGGNTEQLYNSNQVILVNQQDNLFEQRVVVARMLGCYLIDMNHSQSQESLLSDILDYKDIYNKYEEFILGILAPNELFVKQYNEAVKTLSLHMLVYTYLSEYFEVTKEFVDRKVKSLTRR